MAEFATFQDLWPVMIIQAPAHSTVESIEWFCARHDELFKRRERFGTIHDMTRMRGVLDAKARKVMADWTNARALEIAQWHVASATVTDSAVIRGVITAVHWFVKPASPQEITGSMRVGVDFVVGHLQRKGVPISPKLASYQRSLA